MDVNISPQYISHETILKAKDAYFANEDLNSIVLQKFFTDKDFKKIQNAMLDTKFTKDYNPMEHSYSVGEMPVAFARFLQSEQLLSLLSIIVEKRVTGIHASLLKFGWRDYTLLRDEPSAIDVIFDFTPKWPENAGGLCIYRDEEGNFYKFPSIPNSLTIVGRTKEISKFIQYVNHYAKDKNRYIVLGNLL